MAQQDSSFIYRLLVQLDAQEAFTELAGDISMVANRSEDMRNEIAQALNTANAEIGDASAGFKGLQQDMLRTGAAAKKTAASMSRVGATATTNRLKTNQMSQAMLQGFQDAQFGAIGVANNLQVMGEALARQRANGNSFKQVMTSTFQNLLMGPMAIGTVITAFTLWIQNWEEVNSAARQFLNTLTGQQYNEALNNIRSLGKAFEKELKIDPEESITQLLKDVEKNSAEAENVLTKAWNNAKDAQNNAREELNNFKSSLNETQQSLIESGEATIALAGENLRKYQKLKQNVNDLAARTRFYGKSIRFLRKERNKDARVAEKAAEKYSAQENVLRRLQKLTEDEKNKDEEDIPGIPRIKQFIPDNKTIENFANKFPDILSKTQKNLAQAAVKGNILLIPGQGFVTESKWLKQQKDAFRDQRRIIKDQLKALKRTREIGGPQAESVFGAGVIPTEKIAQEQFAFQQRLLKQEEKLQTRRLQNAINFQRARVKKFGKDSRMGQLALQRIKSLERQKKQIEKRFQHKREQNQKNHLKTRIQNINKAGQKLFNDVEQIASGYFSVWMNKRKQDLKDQGKTEKQRREILREEGKKRFQVVKAIKIASAVASGIEAGVHAWSKGMSIGGPPVAAAFLATSIAKTALQIQKLRNLSIGDKLPGGGTSGGGTSGGGKFTQLSPSRNQQRASNFAQQQEQNRRQNSMNKAANKIDKAAEKIQNTQVQYDDKTAADIKERGQRRQDRINN